MAEAVEKKATPNPEQWRERIAEHARSGMSVRRFCKERGVAEHLFFYWRKRLRSSQQPVRFALVERAAASPEINSPAGLELMLTTGERLRIGAGVDAATLRTVVEILRK
jgi:transposase-like protein